MRNLLGLALLCSGCFSEPSLQPASGTSGAETAASASTSAAASTSEAEASTSTSSGDVAEGSSSRTTGSTGRADTGTESSGSTSGGLATWDPEPTWLTRFDSGLEFNGDRADEVIVAQDGTLWVAGAFAFSPSQIFVAQLTAEGEVLDVFDDETSTITNARGLAETSTGFLVAGHGNSASGGTDRLLVELDLTTGEFAEPYDFGDPLPGLDIVESVVIGGTDIPFVAGATRVRGQQRAWLERLPAVGPTWSVEAGTAAEGSRSTDLYRLGPPNDYELVVTGSVHGADGQDTAWVARYSPNGTERWFELYPSPAGYPTVARGVIEGASGNLFVVGTVLVPGEGQNAWVQRLSPGSGSTGWYESFDGNGADDFAFDVAVGPEGDVFACGSSISEASAADLWVARLSSEGEARGLFLYDLGEADEDAIASCVVHENQLIIAGRGHATESVRRDGFVAALPL